MSKLTDDAAAFIKGLKKEGVKSNLQRDVEAAVGRPLEDFEAVYFINGKPRIGFKPGVAYYTLQCGVCKNRAFTSVETAYSPSLDSSEDGEN